MSPYCSAHDEWLIMKLCMFVGYHDANNVSIFGGDAVTQLIFFFKRFILLFTLFMDMVIHSRDAVTVSAAVADGSSMEGHTSLSTGLVTFNEKSIYNNNTWKL